MSTIVLHGDVELENPADLALRFVEAYWGSEGGTGSGPTTFDEDDLRLANRGGARISAAEIAAVLDRRGQIEGALREIPLDASLAAPAASIPWAPLTRLFDAFAEIRGIGFSKMTKALHKKRPALIPMLDSVVQAYLEATAVRTPSSEPFAHRAVALVRNYKREVDRNRAGLRAIKEELAGRGYELTEVRILDILIWSVFAES